MTEVSTETVKPVEYEWFKVVLTHPDHNKKVVFRSLSERRARDFLVRRFPRGSEAHLVRPDGGTSSYETERQGHQGNDVELWDENFDASSWSGPDSAVPPGENAWSDKEG